MSKEPVLEYLEEHFADDAGNAVGGSNRARILR